MDPLDFGPTVAERLISSGYRSLGAIATATPGELSAATGLVEEDAQNIRRLARWRFCEKHHREAEPKPLRQINPSVPEALEKTLLKCLEKQQDERYQSFGKLREDLIETYRFLFRKRPEIREKIETLDAQELCTKGLSLVELGRLDEGIAILKQGIQLDPNDALSHSNLGLAYGMKGWTDQAITEFKLAIELDPNLSDAHFFLAYEYFRSRRFDLAWKHMRIAEKLGMPTQNIDRLIVALRKVSREP